MDLSVALPTFETIQLIGADVRPFLQRMLSNDLARLAPDRAVPAFLLDANGRIVSGGVFVEGDDGDVLAVTPQGWGAALMDGLAKYRLADRVEWIWSARQSHLVSVSEPATAAAWQVLRDGDVRRVVWPMAGAGDVVQVGGAAPAPPEPRVFHCRRIVAGRPWIGVDVQPGAIPLETNLYDWLSNTKGCYVGQEVVERMWSRGRRARHLVRVRFAGPVPPPLDDKRLEVTSSVVCDDEWTGLGFWRGEPPARNAPFEVSGVTVSIVPDEGQPEEAR